MRIKGYSHSVIGGREKNQDSFLINDAKALYVVADGVGGGMKGEVASKMATDGFERLATTENDLSRVMTQLQEDVLKEALDTLGEALMGTTCTVVRIANYLATICHVGDSRLYLFREPIMRQLTEDHEYYDEGMKGTVLASYLGIPSDIHPLKILNEQVPLQTGDRLILCSDGLYKQMTETRMAAMIRELGSMPEGLVKTMAEEAAQKEHSDNVTIVYVEVE